MARILVTGAGGQVGTELSRRPAPAGIGIVPVGHAELDITDPAAVATAVAAVDGVINAAAYTAVDRAESEREQAFAINAEGPRILARACAAGGVPLIHVSTDFVFAGDRGGPWREDDPVAPVNAYGESKAAGEAAIRETWACHVIVRTSWVFSAHGQNFVKTMLRVGASRDELPVVDDQWGLPTAAADLADALLRIAAVVTGDDGPRPGGNPAFGTYHYANTGGTTWCRLANAVFAEAEPVWGRRPAVTPIPTSGYPTPARRPANSVLDCTRIAATFAPARRHWREALASVVADLLSSPQPERTP